MVRRRILILRRDQRFEARPGIGPRSIRELREFLPAGLPEL